MLIDFNGRIYHQIAFDIARGMELPALAYAAATGNQAEVTQLMARGNSEKHDDVAGFCNRFGLAATVMMQRILGTISRKDAARWLRIAAEREPYQAFLWSQLAFAEEQTGHVADAEAHYRRALEDNHYSVDTLNRLVALLVRNGRSREARVYAQRSLQVTPNQPSLRKFLQ